MTPLPEWWLTASGMFFVLGSVAMVVTVVLLAVLVYAVLELRKSVIVLSVKVDQITDKVNAIASTVQQVTSDVGTRATGITRMIDDAAGGAMDIVEKFAPLLVGVATVARVFMAFRGRRRV